MSSVPEALAEAARRESDLASYYELHAKLFELQDKARGEIVGRLELADQPALHARLLQGRSQLSFAQLPLEAGRFAELSMAIAMALKEYYAPDRADEQTLPANIAGWFSLAQRRFEEGCASSEKRDGRIELTLAEMTVDQALKPYLAWAAEQVLPHLDQRQWLRTYCPACGGLPDFAFLAKEAGDRYLVCSRCNSQWLYRRLGCPFCDTQDDAKIVYYPSEDQVYRLYVCDACHRYLKTMDLRQTAVSVLAAVERITTVAMDMTARQEGYQ